VKRIIVAILGGLMLAAGVAACARILGFHSSSRGPFDHRVHVREGIVCVQCHEGIEQAGETGPLHLPDQANCLSCHKKPHNTKRCLNCHGSPYTTQDLTQMRDHLRFAHKRHLARMPGECVRCHADVARPGALLRPRMGTCLSCHEHDKDFTTRECDRCHINLPTEMQPPSTHMIHDEGWMKDHGSFAASTQDLCATCHTQRFCSQCHGSKVPALPHRMAPADPFRPSVHRSGFRARHGEEARINPGMCSTCHSQDSCAGCHADRGVSALTVSPERGSPHPAGWVGVGTTNEHGRAARRDPEACAACHGGAGEMLCVSCHKVGGIGGNPHPVGFSSRRNLDDAPCRLCHPRSGGL